MGFEVRSGKDSAAPPSYKSTPRDSRAIFAAKMI
jgi:hypothetical protein